MAVAGIDAGSLTTKAVVLNGGQIVGKSIVTAEVPKDAENSG